MKTPREILLDRHRAAAPQLDTLRRAVVTEVLNRRAAPSQTLAEDSAGFVLRYWIGFWRELVFPCRRIWTGLAAVWILIFIINFSQHEAGGGAGRTAHSPAVLMNWQAQQRWITELFADRALPETDRPRNIAPKPRTENVEMMTV